MSFATAYAAKTGLTHQAGDTVYANSNSFLLQLGMHPRRPVGAPRLGVAAGLDVNLFDLLGQHLILLRPF
jgi:hypothetical protein